MPMYEWKAYLETVVANPPLAYIVSIYGKYSVVCQVGVTNEHLKHDMGKTKTYDMLNGERPFTFVERFSWY